MNYLIIDIHLIGQNQRNCCGAFNIHHGRQTKRDSGNLLSAAINAVNWVELQDRLPDRRWELIRKLTVLNKDKLSFHYHVSYRFKKRRHRYETWILYGSASASEFSFSLTEEHCSYINWQCLVSIKTARM